MQCYNNASAPSVQSGGKAAKACNARLYAFIITYNYEYYQ